MHKSMFPSAKETGFGVKVGARSASSISPSIVEGLAAKASKKGMPLVFDQSVSLRGDIRIDLPVHIVIRPGVEITMGDDPVWSHGVHLTDRSAYYAGMFTFRPGSEGSILEWWGGLDGNEAQAGAVDGAPVTVGAVLAVGHGYDLPRPSLNFLGRPSFSNVAEAGILIRTSFWGEGEWTGAGFLGPNEPTDPNDPFPRVPFARWDDADLPSLSED